MLDEFLDLVVGRAVHLQVTAPAVVLQGLLGRARQSYPDLASSGADGDRAFKVQHTVEGVDGAVHLGRPMVLRA